MPHQQRSVAALLAPLLAQFVVLAREQHLTRSAELLDVPPSSLSRTLRAMQRDLGFPLTTRRGRNIVLTAEGRALARLAGTALDGLERGVAEIVHGRDPDHGHVRFGFVRTLGPDTVPALLAAFRRDHPGITFSLVQGSTASMTAQLESGALDVALMSPPEQTAMLETRDVGREPIVAVVGPDHRLAARKIVALAELADDDFVLLAPGYGTRTIADELLARAGIVPRVAFETDDTDLAAGMAVAGLGVALLPGRAAPGPALRLRDTGAERVLVVAWSADLPPSGAVRRFRDALIDSDRLRAVGGAVTFDCGDRQPLQSADDVVQVSGG